MVYLDKLKAIRTKKRISRKNLAQKCNISEELIKLLETIPLEDIHGYSFDEIISAIEKMASVLKVDITDLTSLESMEKVNKLEADDDLDELLYRIRCISEKTTQALDNINVSSNPVHKHIRINNDVSGLQVINLYNNIMDKYDFSNINKNNLALKALQEFEYRVEELIPSKIESTESDNNILKDLNKQLQSLYEQTMKSEDDSKNEFDNDLNQGQIKFLADENLGFDLATINDIRKDARTAATLYKELRVNGFSDDKACHLLYIILSSFNHGM